MSPARPPSLQLLSLNVNGIRGKQQRAALFSALQAGPWHVISLQETHHASQEEAAQWCKEGAGPAAPWDGPSFWAAGSSASCGVALLFKPTPLLSGLTAAVSDPNGRFVAAQGSLSGSQTMFASVYAPADRQERAPFFQQQLQPALPTGTPLVLGGDWNCVAEDLDLVGGQPGTRQHGFHNGLLPLSHALGLHDVFRLLHPTATDFTHTATTGCSSARLDRWLRPCGTSLTQPRQRLCLAAGLGTMCCATLRRWSGFSRQVGQAAWSFLTSARHMTASAAPGFCHACTAWALARMPANGSTSCWLTPQQRPLSMAQQTAQQACSGRPPQTQQLSKPSRRPLTGSYRLMHSKLVRGRQRASLLMSCGKRSSNQPAARSQAQMVCPMSCTLSFGICSAQSCSWCCMSHFSNSMPACRLP